MNSNLRIAKNTVFLYLRMICSVLINLYASRIILRALGVEDFGIYNLVAGIVTMLSFLNTTMAGCTSRFLTYELGRGDADKLQKTFSGAVVVHVCIALIVFIVGETIGLWFVNTQLVYSELKLRAVNWVYQFSLISSLITFIQVPYVAAVIAHERMGFYALAEILKVSLKLAVSFIVLLVSDRMIAYACFLLVTGVIIFMLYFLYARRHFGETVLTTRVSKDIIKPMLKFTSWDLYGNASVLVQQQGVNVLINRFFGAALNAATGVATQASSAVSMFVTSFTMALRPPLIKKYASGDMEGLERLFLLAIIICFVLAEMICLPLYLRIDYLMMLWLNEVPPNAVSFCKWMLLTNAIGIINTLFTTIIHATGNIKGLSLISGSIYLSTVLFAFIAFRLSCAPEIAYAILFIVTIFVLMSNVLITHKLLPQVSLWTVIKGLIIPIILIATTVFISITLNSFLPNNIVGVLLLFLLNAVVALFLFYIIWFVPKFGWKSVNVFRHEG